VSRIYVPGGRLSGSPPSLDTLIAAIAGRQHLALTSKSGLPEPLVNTQVQALEVDFHWPQLNLIVEVDGPAHTRPRTTREDAVRDARLRAAGHTLQSLWRRSSVRPITIRWISEVPSPISSSGASRYSRSISYSFE
jgi:hypothetical protein